MGENDEESVSRRYVSEDRVRFLIERFGRDIDRRLGELATVRDLELLAARVLSKDAIKEMISESLSESHTRGWTSRERTMTVVLFFVSVATLTVAVLGLLLRSHGKG